MLHVGSIVKSNDSNVYSTAFFVWCEHIMRLSALKSLNLLLGKESFVKLLVNPDVVDSSMTRVLTDLYRLEHIVSLYMYMLFRRTCNAHVFYMCSVHVQCTCIPFYSQNTHMYM